jgi:hypothetical protein
MSAIKKVIYILLLLVCSSLNLWAQQGTVSSGRVANGAGGSSSYSIGQVSYSFSQAAGFIVTQGIQQPDIAPTTAGTLSGTQSVCVSGTNTFSSTVSGGSWTSSDPAVATVISSTGVITGVAAGTATITYTVTGTGGNSDATATRLVTVKTAVGITAQPLSVGKVCTGGSASATVVATGSNLSYQWYLDGKAIGGQFSATLSLTNLRNKDAGSYTCTVSSDCGSITSTAFVLTVMETTTITTQPTKLATVAPGSTVTESISAVGVNLKYQWFKDGSRLNGQNSATLTLRSVKTSASGSYTCFVTGDCGSVTSNIFKLTVSSPAARIALIDEEETSGPLQISLYPNPTVTDLVTVRIQGVAQQPVQLQLMDMKGHVVLQRALTVETQQHTEVLDVSRVPAGTLLLRVSTPGQTQIRKLLKQ